MRMLLNSLTCITACSAVINCLRFSIDCSKEKPFRMIRSGVYLLVSVMLLIAFVMIGDK